MKNQNLVGSDTNGVSVPVADYKQQQSGFSLGGPITRNRLPFFVPGDFRHDNRPFPSSIQLGPTGDTTGVGITQARFDSVTSILADSFGINAGTWRAPQINNPETNLFGKLDLELGVNNHVELSGTLINVNQDKLIHTYRLGFTQPPSFSNARDGYELSASGYYVKDETRTLRGKWTTTFGDRFANELILGRTTIGDNRPPVSNYPLILVGGNSAGTYIAAGAERFSHANSLDQRVVELTDNVTFPVGRHLLTFGTHNEFIHFRNVFFPGSMGIWNFLNPDSLAAGRPNFYARALPGLLRPDGPVADFNVTQVGFYGEDRFRRVAAGDGYSPPVHRGPERSAEKVWRGRPHQRQRFSSGNIDCRVRSELQVSPGPEARSRRGPRAPVEPVRHRRVHLHEGDQPVLPPGDRKSTRLNSSHSQISYA